MIISIGSLLIIISILISALVGLFLIPYYVGIFILGLIFICLRTQVPNYLFYVKNFISSIVFWLNYLVDIIVTRMLSRPNECQVKNKNHASIVDGLLKYRLLPNNSVNDEKLHLNDTTVRHRRFESSDRLVKSDDAKNIQVANSFYKRNSDNLTSNSGSTLVLLPVNFNQNKRTVVNSGVPVNTSISKGIEMKPSCMDTTLYKSNSPNNSKSNSTGNRTSRLSQTYFEFDDGMKENVNSSFSSISPWDDTRASSLKYKYNQSLNLTQVNSRNQQTFLSRVYSGSSTERRHDSEGGAPTHQSRYAGPGQLPRVCLGRQNVLLTFSGTSLSKCVQSPVRAKPSTVLPKTRSYRLLNESSPKFFLKSEEISRKRIRNSYEEDDDDDDVAKRQCKANELSNADDLEEDFVNLKRVREDSPKSDFEQQHQKPKKRVCNNEILSSLSSSKNFLNTSARKRKAAVVDWSRSSTPVQEKVFRKSVSSPEVFINHQERDLSLKEGQSSATREKLHLEVCDSGANHSVPNETASLQLEKSAEKSRMFNYTLFDVPISISESPVKESSPTTAYADLNLSLEAVPKSYSDKKTFDTKELQREAISKRLSSFWDAFGTVDVNKARNAMAPQKSTNTHDGVPTQVVTSLTPALSVPSTVTSTLQQPCVPNESAEKDKNESINFVNNTNSPKSVVTSEQSMFTYGQSLLRSRELSSFNLKTVGGSSAIDSPAGIVSSSEAVSGQNSFSISSSPLTPVTDGSCVVAPLIGSNDLQRSKSSVSLSAVVLPTPSSIAIASPGLSQTNVGTSSSNVLSSPVMTLGAVPTSLPVSAAPANTLDSSSSKPLFGLTSSFSHNMKNSPLDVKQNPNIIGEKNVGGFSFNFSSNSAANISSGKSEKTSSFSVPQTTSSSVSSAQLILTSSPSLAPTPSLGGFSFPKFTSNNNTSNNNKVETSMALSIFGSSQTSSNGFASSQTSSDSGFGSVQTSASGFRNAPTSVFGKVEASPSSFGSVQITPTQGFGSTQATSASELASFPLSQVTSAIGFGSVSTTSSGFGNVQATLSAGFGTTHSTPKSVFENSQTTPGGFGNVPVTSAAGFGSVSLPSSNMFGTSQTTTNAATEPFSFGAKLNAPAFSFGSTTVTSSSVSTPVQSNGFGSTVTSSGQQQSAMFNEGSDANKNKISAGGTKNMPFAFGSVNSAPKVGGFAFGSPNPSEVSTSATITLNFGSNTSSQAPTSTTGKFSFNTPQTQPQLSFGSGFSTSQQSTQSPFSTIRSQQSETAAAQKQSFSFGTLQQPAFGIQQVQNSGAGTLAQQAQASFGTLQAQAPGSSSLVQLPQATGANPLLSKAGQQPSPFGTQVQQAQSAGGFGFNANGQQQQQQQQQQQAASSGGLFSMPTQVSPPFQFGSTPPGTLQPGGGFSFGNAATLSTTPMVNFSAGSNANSSFQAGAGGFGGSAAGMFSIGSGSSASRARSARTRRSIR